MPTVPTQRFRLATRSVPRALRAVLVAITLSSMFATQAFAADPSPTVPDAQATSSNRGPSTDRVLEGDHSGKDVLDNHGDKVAEIARRHHTSVAEIEAVLNDSSSQVSESGTITFAEPAPASAPEGAAAAAAEAGPFPYTDTFRLHSKPGSARTIYLDFNGETISGTVWPSDDLGPYTALPYDTDGFLAFNTTEMDAVQAIWQRVAEDYAPLDVDVTTEDPGLAKIDRSSAADTVYGTRIVITNSSAADNTLVSTTGVAQLGAFDMYSTWTHAQLQPAWAFAPGLSFNTKRLADVISHELGHTLGLRHDGQTGGTDPEYYRGQGPWAPIMGAAYDRPIAHWSKGEYVNANNLQDDIAVMASHGASSRTDDHTNDITTATPLTSTNSGFITPGGDVDLFKYTAAVTGVVTFNAMPAVAGPNLDILLALYSAAPVLLAQNNPPAAMVSATTATGMSASISFAVTAGVSYYLQVSPSGLLDPLTTGYSTYGSLGQYTVTASVPGATTPTVNSFSPASGVVGTIVTITGTNLSGATAVKFNGTAAAFTVNNATQITATVPAAATSGKVTVTTPGGTATSATNFTVTVTVPPAVPTVASFSPASGVVGASVSITGTNFSGATAVRFNGAAAAFTVNSATLITATVPAAATTGKVTVTTPAGTATSASSFTVTVAASSGAVVRNPGFEGGSANPTPWVSTAGVISNDTKQPPHSGLWNAWLNGFGTANTETLYQDVTIPAGVTSATFTMWLHIDTQETGTSVFDTLNVQVRNTSNTVLSTLATYSNANAAAGYTQRTFNLTAFAGQTIRLYFVGQEDTNLRTSFVIDDIALTIS